MPRKNRVAAVRRITGLSQQEFAEIIDRKRPTIQAVEYGRLPVSHQLAHQISLHTGAAEEWILGRQPGPPTCQHNPAQLFTREVFEHTRSQVKDPRTGPVDAFVVREYIEGFCSELRGFGLEAYDKNEIIFFYSKWRRFSEIFKKRWPGAKPVKAQEFDPLLEASRQRKLGQGKPAQTGTTLDTQSESGK